MRENVDDMCVAMDKLMLQNLELMEEKVSVNMQIEELLRDGHIELAKARYICGKETVGLLQVPTEDIEIKSLFKLETTLEEDKDSIVPHFDVNLRKTDENGKELQDPIKWFGILVPQNLKNAQKRFQTVLYLAAKNANIHSKIVTILNELETLKSLKTNFLMEEK